MIRIPMTRIDLDPAQRAFLEAARRAVLATIDPHGRPRLVPICFVIVEPNGQAGAPRIVTPIDEKPKSGADPLELARIRDVRARPEVGILVDRWDEDWSRLGWLRLVGRATVLEPGAMPGEVLDALRSKYSQYRVQRLEARPAIDILVESTSSWGDLTPD